MCVCVCVGVSALRVAAWMDGWMRGGGGAWHGRAGQGRQDGHCSLLFCLGVFYSGRCVRPSVCPFVFIHSIIASLSVFLVGVVGGVGV